MMQLVCLVLILLITLHGSCGFLKTFHHPLYVSAPNTKRNALFGSWVAKSGNSVKTLTNGNSLQKISTPVKLSKISALDEGWLPFKRYFEFFQNLDKNFLSANKLTLVGVCALTISVAYTIKNIPQKSLLKEDIVKVSKKMLDMFHLSPKNVDLNSPFVNNESPPYELLKNLGTNQDSNTDIPGVGYERPNFDLLRMEVTKSKFLIRTRFALLSENFVSKMRSKSLSSSSVASMQLPLGENSFSVDSVFLSSSFDSSDSHESSPTTQFSLAPTPTFHRWFSRWSSSSLLAPSNTSLDSNRTTLMSTLATFEQAWQTSSTAEREWKQCLTTIVLSALSPQLRSQWLLGPLASLPLLKDYYLPKKLMSFSGHQNGTQAPSATTNSSQLNDGSKTSQRSNSIAWMNSVLEDASLRSFSSEIADIDLQSLHRHVDQFAQLVHVVLQMFWSSMWDIISSESLEEKHRKKDRMMNLMEDLWNWLIEIDEMYNAVFGVSSMPVSLSPPRLVYQGPLCLSQLESIVRYFADNALTLDDLVGEYSSAQRLQSQQQPGQPAKMATLQKLVILGQLAGISDARIEEIKTLSSKNVISTLFQDS